MALDALLEQPQLSTVSVDGSGGSATLYVSAAKSTTVKAVQLPAGFVMEQQQYDSTGKPVQGTATTPGPGTSQSPPEASPW